MRRHLLLSLLLSTLALASLLLLSSTHASSSSHSLTQRERVRSMYNHAYSNYLKYALPHDELKPLTKTWTDSLAELGNAKATQGQIQSTEKSRAAAVAARKETPPSPTPSPYTGFSLTLIDSLSTTFILGHYSDFVAAVDYLAHTLNWNTDVRLHVFETNIRILGGLLSAHLLLTDASTSHLIPANLEYPSLLPAEKGKKKVWRKYDDSLLTLAYDLGKRLLRAFPAYAHPHNTTSTLPYPFVHLVYGVEPGEVTSTCTACVSTLLLEFGTLSVLTKDQRFYDVANDALNELWRLRSNVTGLFPNSFDLQGNIGDSTSSIGSGIDSSLEYLLKTSIVFDNKKFLDMFERIYDANERHLKVNVVYESVPQMNNDPSETTKPKSASILDAAPLVTPNPHRLFTPLPLSFQQCERTHIKDWYIESDFHSGQHVHMQFNALGAFYPGMQVLAGRVEDAIRTYDSIYELWNRYKMIPERYFILNGQLHPSERHYPLRPEFIESTYYMYRATKDVKYLRVAEEILDDLNAHTRTDNGFASISNVDTKEKVDRMESYFLSESLKYLYLIFDGEEHWMHSTSTPAPSSSSSLPRATSWIFSTEGHVLPVRRDMQLAFNDDHLVYDTCAERSESRAPVSSPSSSSSSKKTTQRDDLEGYDPLEVRWYWLMLNEFVAEHSYLSPTDLGRELFHLSSRNTIVRELIPFLQAPSDSTSKHPFSSIIHYNQGSYHHRLFGRIRDYEDYTEARYYVQRLLGWKDAVGGSGSQGMRDILLATSENQREHFAYQFAHTRDVTISVRDALAQRRQEMRWLNELLYPERYIANPEYRSRGVTYQQCLIPIPTFIQLSSRAPPSFFYAYDIEWVRLQFMRREQYEKTKEQGEWMREMQMKQSINTAITNAATESSSTTPSTSSTPADNPSSTPSTTTTPPSTTTATTTGQPKVHAVQSTQEMLSLLQQLIAKQGGAAAGSTINTATTILGGDALGGSASLDPLLPSTEFSIEQDVLGNAFHIHHTKSNSILTIRNLGSEQIEIVNSVVLRKKSQEKNEQTHLSRIGMVTLGNHAELHSNQLHIDVDGICDGIVTAAGGYFGRPPPSTSFTSSSAPSVLRARVIRASPADACAPLTAAVASQVRGAIVFVERGHCTFTEKARHLTDSGAVGMLVWNRRGHTPDDPNVLFVMGTEYPTGEDNIALTPMMLDEHAGVWLSKCLVKNERAYSAEVKERAAENHAASNKPMRFLPELIVEMRRLTHTSGEEIVVPPFPSFSSELTPADTKTAHQSFQPVEDHIVAQTAAGPSTLSVTGTKKFFTVTTQTKWQTEIVLDEKTQMYSMNFFTQEQVEMKKQLKEKK